MDGRRRYEIYLVDLGGVPTAACRPPMLGRLGCCCAPDSRRPPLANKVAPLLLCAARGPAVPLAAATVPLLCAAAVPLLCRRCCGPTVPPRALVPLVAE